MKWFTDIDIPKFSTLLEHDSRLVLIGSCFSDNIASKLALHGVRYLANPFGTVYNPLSISNQIREILDPSSNDKAIVFHDEVFKSLLHHSSFNRISREDLEQELNEKRINSKSFLREANLMIITLGTSWVYEHDEFGLVANCHKIPQKRFRKRLLSVEEIYSDYVELQALIKAAFPQLKIMLNISPVRHLRDGFVENTRSKAILIEAARRLCEESGLFYFPSYEIQMDVLRDYRFYAQDLVHPSQGAVDFIWDKFVDSMFSKEAVELMDEVKKLSLSLQHRPQFPNSESALNFSKKLNDKREALKRKIPYLVL